jgi:hypothetical protein
MSMKLLTAQNLKDFKKYGAQLNESDPVLVVKFFCPTSRWTWYAQSYNPNTRIFFGYVEGFENEWGRFSLDELEEAIGPLGMKVERDRCWTPKRFSELKS